MNPSEAEPGAHCPNPLSIEKIAEGLLEEPLLSLTLAHIRLCESCEALLAYQLAKPSPLDGTWLNLQSSFESAVTPHLNKLPHDRQNGHPESPEGHLAPEGLVFRSLPVFWEWTGFHVNHRVPCLLRMMRPEFAGVDELQRGFLARVETIQQLPQPGLPKVLHRGLAPLGPFLVEKIPPGRSLNGSLGAFRGDLGLVVDLARGVLVGLDALHQVGLTHGPLLHKGVHWDESTRQATLTDACLGPDLINTSLEPEAAFFQSPEQALGTPLHPGSDFFSLGCLLRSLLLGKPPWNEGDRAILTSANPDQPNLPDFLREFLGILLQRELTDRPKNSQDILLWLAHNTQAKITSQTMGP